jgi:hypothetical protein
VNLLGLLTVLAVTWVELARKLRHLVSSDFLYLPALFEDMRYGWAGIQGWQLTPAPYFFPDMLCFGVARWVTGDAGSAMAWYAFGYRLATLGLWYLVARAVALPRAEAFSFAVSTLLVVMVASVTAPAHTSLIVAVPTYHGGTLLIGTALVLLQLGGAVEKHGGRVGWCCLVFAGTLSDPSVVWQFVAPMLGARYFLVRRAIDERRAALRQLGLTAGTLFAAVLARLLINASGVVRIPTSIDLPSTDGLIRFGHGMVELARTAPGVVAIFACSAAIGVWAHRRAGSNAMPRPDADVRATRFLLETTGLSIALSWLFAGLTGNLKDVWSFRYLWPTFFWAPHALVLAALQSGRLSRKALAGAPIAVTVLALAILSRRWTPVQPGAFTIPYDRRTEALDRLASEENLRFGYSNYWNAKLISFGSRVRLRVNQLRPDLTPHFWINNARWYLEPGERRFIITEGLDRKAILTKLGPPSSIRDCAGLEVFLYDRDIDSALGPGLYADVRARTR